jgi:hypothetical protein
VTPLNASEFPYLGGAVAYPWDFGCRELLPGSVKWFCRLLILSGVLRRPHLAAHREGGER